MSSECPICITPIGSTNCMTTPCGHSFHATCIIQNCTFESGNACPLCRTTIHTTKFVNPSSELNRVRLNAEIRIRRNTRQMLDRLSEIKRHYTNHPNIITYKQISQHVLIKVNDMLTHKKYTHISLNCLSNMVNSYIMLGCYTLEEYNIIYEQEILKYLNSQECDWATCDMSIVDQAVDYLRPLFCEIFMVDEFISLVFDLCQTEQIQQQEKQKRCEENQRKIEQFYKINSLIVSVKGPSQKSDIENLNKKELHKICKRMSLGNYGIFSKEMLVKLLTGDNL